MLQKSNLLLFIWTALILSSCSNTGIMLSGERQAVLPNFTDISIDEDAASEQDLSLNKTLKVDATHAGGNERHSGGNLSLSFPLTLSWSFRAHGIKDKTIELPQPIIAKGKVFVIDGRSKLRAFDLDTGEAVWSFRLDSHSEEHIPGIIGGLAYRDGTVVAHSGRKNLYAFDIKTGDILWQKTVEDSLRGGPTLSELNNVIVTDLDGTVYVFSLSDGALIWQRAGFPVDTVVYGAPSPAVIDQTVIVSGQGGEIAIYDILSGALIWADSLASFNPRTPLEQLGDIRAFAATDDKNAYFISQSGRMSAFDVNTGFELWAKPISGIEMPWIAGLNLFVVTIDGRLLSIRKSDGAVRWVNNLPGAIAEKVAVTRDLPRYLGPIVANGEVLIVSKRGELFRFEAYSGKLISKTKITSQITTPPQIGQQHLVTLSRDGTIRVFD